MAGKPNPPAGGQIKQLLRLHQQGAGKKHIARTLGISRNWIAIHQGIDYLYLKCF